MRANRILLTAAVGVLPFLAAAHATAHHAFAAEFDANQPVRFTATIRRVRWTNPHTWFFVDVTQPDGTVEEWAIEAGTPNVLYRRGFTKDSLEPGTEVIIDGYRAKDGSRRANGRDITLPDGRTLFMTSPNTGAPPQ
ncbi:MAG TPA: DUF6152 family protein [Gammaproteobacteria bacterium]